MKVKELIHILKNVDQDMEIGLKGIGSSWYPCHARSHGDLGVSEIAIHFMGGRSKNIILIHGGSVDVSNGYRPVILREL